MPRKSKRPNHPLRKLRSIIGPVSQKDFAKLVRIPWRTLQEVENGKGKNRGRLSIAAAMRIGEATGVRWEELTRKGSGKLLDTLGISPYTREDFQEWRKNYHRPTKQEVARSFCSFAVHLRLLMEAAADLKSGKSRFPALCADLTQWMQSVREGYGLGAAIEKRIGQIQSGPKWLRKLPFRPGEFRPDVPFEVQAKNLPQGHRLFWGLLAEDWVDKGRVIQMRVKSSDKGTSGSKADFMKMWKLSTKAAGLAKR